jgi:hypothetical protein
MKWNGQLRGGYRAWRGGLKENWNGNGSLVTAAATVIVTRAGGFADLALSSESEK